MCQDCGLSEKTEYLCPNAGCEDGVFVDQPEQWFRERNLPVPTECFSCRRWKERLNVQGDIMLHCKTCDRDWKITKKFQILYHRHVGWLGDLFKITENGPCFQCKPIIISDAREKVIVLDS